MTLQEKITILYDRPEPRTDIPHVSLLYEGFSEFLDNFHGRKDVPGLDLSKQRALEFRVNDFADEMASFYETESGRRFTAIPTMDVLFSAFACEGEMGPFLGGAFDPRCQLAASRVNTARCLALSCSRTSPMISKSCPTSSSLTTLLARLTRR